MTAKEKELTERIRDLDEKLAASVPKAEFEIVKSNLEISDLKMRLSVAEAQASQVELPESAEGRLDEDGFEEREAEGLTAEISQMGFSAEDIATGGPEESEITSSEGEDREEAAQSSIESEITDQSESTSQVLRVA